jgi:hypothetical protein
MQVFDNFISAIPGFEGDVPIPAIPVSTRSPSSESASDPSARTSVGASISGIKINEPTPKASSALTPLSGSQKKIPICRSNRYARLRLPSILEQFLTYDSLSRVP